MSKRILIIGGTSGYGAGMAEVLSENNDVIVAGRSSAVPMDVTSVTSIESFKNVMAGHKHEFDVVIYSSGLAIGKDVLKDKDMSDFEKVFQVNTLGLGRVAQAFFPQLLKTKGVFIHIGSIANELHYVGGADYCASKAASSTIMKTLRYEWLGSGIRTCSIEIGLGNTKFQENRYNGNSDKMVKHTTGVRQIEPTDLGEFVKTIIDLPDYLNLDTIILKPLDQASHGISVLNKKQQF